ncbi:brain acid soluble protein 1 [Desmodus rotundus]|uniref:brain acid soluble protein 1 n=1 Tax=Desmodus rotundus TaxID=9430 RepID=UPI0039E619FD
MGTFPQAVRWEAGRAGPRPWVGGNTESPAPGEKPAVQAPDLKGERSRPPFIRKENEKSHLKPSMNRPQPRKPSARGSLRRAASGHPRPPLSSAPPSSPVVLKLCGRGVGGERTKASGGETGLRGQKLGSLGRPAPETPRRLAHHNRAAAALAAPLSPTAAAFASDAAMQLPRPDRSPAAALTSSPPATPRAAAIAAPAGRGVPGPTAPRQWQDSATVAEPISDEILPGGREPN